ncbi:MAG: L-aspartate oxidase [Rhodoglobus sp.]
MARVIVVGTGIAGLITAYRASATHDVVLVTKAEMAESNTKYAQGGIAAVMFADDSVASHIDDTVRAGAGLCDRDAVEVLCSEGPLRVNELMALGVEFDRIASGELARGHEAAHSWRRVIHAGGDATGLAVEVALLRAVRALAVETHEFTFMRDLITETDAAGMRRVTGIDVIAADGSSYVIDGDSVVIASGGAGQLYKHSTNPSVTTGDGVAAAYRAGAALADVEFYQFHPTSLAVPGNPLISEAVRGEGAILVDEHGTRFMFDVHPDGELAPRDVVARGIARAMEKQGGRPIMLDASGLGAEFLATRFPGITRVCAQHGFDWAQERIPVTPAAHYWMGGIRTDLSGRTSVRGLYAVGEAACTGVHGANRLASNSLLESLVFAWRAADALNGPQYAITVAAVQPHSPGVGTVAFTRAQLRELMWTHVGLERDAPRLRQAATILATWGTDSGTVEAAENANLLDLARLVVVAALRRTESRGAHKRTDFPEANEDLAFSTRWALATPTGDRVPAEDLAEMTT